MHNLITNDEENRMALVFIERLMDENPHKASREGILLRYLTDQVIKYELKYTEKEKHGQ